MTSGFSIQQLNWADIGIISILLLSSLISLMRGFVREAISLATWIVAAWVAICFAPLLADYLTKYIATPSIRTVAAFAALFIIVLILGGMINLLFSQLVDKTGLNGTDRLLGFVFGIARGILLVGVIILLGNISALNQDPWWTSSQLIPFFQGLAQWLQSFVPTQIHNLSQAF